MLFKNYERVDTSQLREVLSALHADLVVIFPWETFGAEELNTIAEIHTQYVLASQKTLKGLGCVELPTRREARYEGPQGNQRRLLGMHWANETWAPKQSCLFLQYLANKTNKQSMHNSDFMNEVTSFIEASPDEREAIIGLFNLGVEP